MPAFRGSFDALIAPGAYAVYADEYQALPAEYVDHFNILTSERAFEEVIITSGLGTTPAKPEGENVAIDRPFQVGKVKMVVTSFGLGYEVTHEMWQDDLYNAVAEPSSRFLAQSGRDTEERQAFAMLNTAFTTQQAWDAVSLINVAHPVVGGGAAQANRPTPDAALGVASLQASLERFRLAKNERGLRIVLNPATLLVPVQLEWLADEILGSPHKPHVATNEINVLAAGRIGLTRKTSRFLTSASAWFVMVPKGQHKLNFFWREKPNMDRDFDKRARIAIFMNFMRFGTATFDWRGLDGSTG